MSYAGQMVELGPEERNPPTKTVPHAFRGLSRVSILLLMACSTYGFCLPHAVESGPAFSNQAKSNQAKSESVAEKWPVTVADSIQMTRLGDPQYNAGATSRGLVAKFSPDGKWFVVVVRKGSLETNTNEYSLILFATEEVLHSPSPRVLLSMVSSSNRPAIQNVAWLDDNDTILFLGERPGETTQLYSFQCSSKELKKLTNHATNLTSFVAAPNGAEIVFAAESPELHFINERSARQGVTVTSEILSELIAGMHGGEDDFRALFMKQAGGEAETRIMTEGGARDNEMWLSPDGLHLVLWTLPPHTPDIWAEYDDPFLKETKHTGSTELGNRTIFQYELVDLRTHMGRPLLDAPIPGTDGGSEVAWSPDSQSVVVSHMYLPLNIDDAQELARRKTHPFLVEVKISNRQFVKISDEDLRLRDWDAKTNDVVCDAGRVDSLTGKVTPKTYFRKSNDNNNAMWSRSNIPQAQEKAASALPDIVLDENMNQPPRIFAVDPGTDQKSVLMDLNPQVQTLAFARVEEVAWKTSHHSEVKAGLYWPLDYVAGKKYPLVIQTHGWNSDRFWMDGPYSTAFAAQPLAGKGFFVLQVSDTDWHVVDTPKEAPAAMAIYDSAIDFLDRKGLVDRNRIGIIGFSRTFLYVTYTLTHSKHHFAAAAVADGVDYSYFQYLQSANVDQTWASDFDSLNGAPPFGKGLLKWFKVSPAFLMDRVETPLRIQTLDPGSLLSDWHWFSGLTRLGKPVEMIYMPGGTHTLEKPWDRMISLQGNVDWFSFWLKGEEDPDPAKAEQYKRWRNLRAAR